MALLLTIPMQEKFCHFLIEKIDLLSMHLSFISIMFDKYFIDIYLSHVLKSNVIKEKERETEKTTINASEIL